MLEWLQKLWLGHVHRWKIVAQHENHCCYGKGTRFHLQCEHCGITKVRGPWA